MHVIIYICTIKLLFSFTDIYWTPFDASTWRSTSFFFKCYIVFLGVHVFIYLTGPLILKVWGTFLCYFKQLQFFWIYIFAHLCKLICKIIPRSGIFRSKSMCNLICERL